MKLFVLLFSIVSINAWSATYQSIGGVPANELCDAGSVFKTLKPVAVCDSWQGKPSFIHGEIFVPSEWTCLASHKQHLEIKKDTLVCAHIIANEADVVCDKFVAATQSSTVVVEEKAKLLKDNLIYYNYTIPPCAE